VGLNTRWLIAAALAASVAGCAAGATAPSRLPLGQPFTLRAGESAIVDSRLTIAFERVVSDSRCPMDALCVWAGDAVARLSLKVGRGAPDTRELHTALNGSEVSFSDYKITLTSLAPYPQSAGKIRAEDYVATLTVSPR
jgi:hypothetical protein